jgi:hypothetical protein
MKARSIVLPAVALALCAAGCARDQPAAGGGTSVASGSHTAGTTSPSTGPSESGSPVASGSPVIEDGRNFAFVTAVDASASQPTVTYDLAYFLTGDAATQAAKDHGDEAPPPNDYYIVNDNPALRTVPLAPNARLVLLDWKHCCDQTFDGVLSDFADAVNGDAEMTVDGHVYKGPMSPYWLIARDGQIVRIEEQYLP